MKAPGVTCGQKDRTNHNNRTLKINGISMKTEEICPFSINCQQEREM